MREHITQTKKKKKTIIVYFHLDYNDRAIKYKHKFLSYARMHVYY
jgi:hypothetical protein